ncbi:RDD family protein [Rothia terrae]|uniref:RDD family protein n=1 Tax=Rothia terrae TaxID=396015 RepID=A0A7H2BBN5_9MICC|nr:RDD family protein [Rothia terrae]QNV37081.1 RDD family protein [Rothia terrae]
MKNDSYGSSSIKNNEQPYPGQSLGRPSDGPGSIASIIRRVIAFFIDWYLCWGLLALAGFADQSWLLLIVVYLYMSLLIGFGGHTVGQLVVGAQVQTLDGRPVGYATAFLRSFLVMLLLPVLMMDKDTRGVHDRIRHTALVRIR